MSCDSTPLAYFLCDNVKSLVYKNNPLSIPELKYEIIRILSEIEYVKMSLKITTQELLNHATSKKLM